MRKLLVVGLLALAGSVQAADWVFITQSVDGRNFYIDRNSIAYDKVSSAVVAWIKVDNYSEIDNMTGEVENEYKYKDKHFCKTRKNMTLAYVFYNNGIVTASADESDLRRTNSLTMSEIIPDSIQDGLFQAVCTRPGFVITSAANTDFNLIDKLLGNSTDSTSSDVAADAADAATDAAETANQAYYDNLFNQAIDRFLARPENYVFVDGSKALDILDEQVKKLGNDPNLKYTNFDDVLNIARARTAKLISIPPLPSQKKITKPSTPQKAQLTNKNTVFL